MGPTRRGDLVAFHYPPIRSSSFSRGSLVSAGITDYIDSYRDNFPSEPNSNLYPGAKDMLRDSVRDGEVVGYRWAIE